MPAVRTSIAALFAIVAIGGGGLFAQITGTETETIEVPIGSIFEIQGAATMGATYNWTLTQGEEFMEAGRDTMFRTRFSRAGTYALAAEATIDTTTVTRLFRIEVAQVRAEELSVPVSTDVPVTLLPAPKNGTVPITQDQQVLRIAPVGEDSDILAVDFDTSSDSNGDGNPQNDEDTSGTLFRSEGSTLHVWFVGGKARTIRIGALTKEKKSLFATVRIGNGNDPVLQQDSSEPAVPLPTLATNSGRKILVLKSDNGDVQLALSLPVEDDLSELLLVWDFGDGTSSLLDRPIHTYAESGTYGVTVEIRELGTGAVREKVSDTLLINRLREEVPDPAPNKETSGGSSFFGIVLKLLLGLIVSGAIGALAVFVAGAVKRRGFSLEKTMEHAEKTLVRTPQETVSVAAPPMEITAEEVREERMPEVLSPPVEFDGEALEQESPTPLEETQPIASEEPDASATLKVSETPSWLTDGLNEAEVEDPPQEEPRDFNEQSPPPPGEENDPPIDAYAPNGAHTPLEPSPEELKIEPENAPNWLQAGIAKAEEQGQAPHTPPPAKLQESHVPTTQEKVPEPSPLDETVALVKAEDILPLEADASSSPKNSITKETDTPQAQLPSDAENKGS